ncbi:MAG: nitrilase [marine bacterium B5-7]|nr:MAG: nitrilase [marine bacterium B5-7]
MPRCAVIQMCSCRDLDSNLASAERLIADAVNDGAQLVSLPENFALMSDPPALIDCALHRLGDIEKFLSETARSHRIVLIGGSVPAPVTGKNRVYGACQVYGSDGARLAEYHKMHLFDVIISDSESYLESAYTAPGDSIEVIASEFGTVGLSICYDVRFPEMYRELTAQGAQILSVPSAFTVPTGRTHWEVLLRARAIENQCYVIAPAQSGQHENGRLTYGHSLVIAPSGEILAERAEQVGHCIADIDLDQLTLIRKRFPVLGHRRL